MRGERPDRDVTRLNETFKKAAKCGLRNELRERGFDAL
jgi:hypothetical protein